jgi:hypothetical protein
MDAGFSREIRGIADDLRVIVQTDVDNVSRVVRVIDEIRTTTSVSPQGSGSQDRSHRTNRVHRQASARIFVGQGRTLFDLEKTVPDPETGAGTGLLFAELPYCASGRRQPMASQALPDRGLAERAGETP